MRRGRRAFQSSSLPVVQRALDTPVTPAIAHVTGRYMYLPCYSVDPFPPRTAKARASYKRHLALTYLGRQRNHRLVQSASRSCQECRPLLVWYPIGKQNTHHSRPQDHTRHPSEAREQGQRLQVIRISDEGLSNDRAGETTATKYNLAATLILWISRIGASIGQRTLSFLTSSSGRPRSYTMKHTGQKKPPWSDVLGITDRASSKSYT
eukprot:scaffold201_cov405-Prasinococcus_capsulatus_cf.AAC.52